MDAESTVRAFCEAAGRCDVEAMLAFFADDAVYHNIPIQPVEGKAAIAATLAQFLGPATTECEFEIVAIASAGGTVLTERVDRFVIGGKQIALPVMGTFEISESGKIQAWRDYFDLQQFTAQTS